MKSNNNKFPKNSNLTEKNLFFFLLFDYLGIFFYFLMQNFFRKLSFRSKKSSNNDISIIST